MTDLINFFYDNNFFEENANYLICIGDNCVDAIGKHSDHGDTISHSHKHILPNGTMQTENVFFDLKSLRVLECGSVSERCGAWCQIYKINENEDWFFDSKDKVTFHVTSPNSSKESITVSVQKVSD